VLKYIKKKKGLKHSRNKKNGDDKTKRFTIASTLLLNCLIRPLSFVSDGFWLFGDHYIAKITTSGQRRMGGSWGWNGGSWTLGLEGGGWGRLKAKRSCIVRAPCEPGRGVLLL
jgi:hypothetical protein